jgi:cell division protein FtsQ
MRYSKSKIFKAVSVLVLVVVIFLSLGKFRSTICKDIAITVLDSAEVNFIDRDSVFAMMYSVSQNILGHNLDSINTYRLDCQLKKCPYIRKASIYKTVSGVLHIDVMQRRPILMVLNGSQSYYVDNDGMVFAAGKGNACQCIVVNGYVKDKYDFTGGKVYKADDTSSNSQTSDLFKLARLINNDDFWRDQVEQIYINKLGEYEVVPMVGSHVLALGSIEDYDKKMFTLKQFYFKALPKLGWNTYKQISVKYNNQVVCKRRTK